MINVESAKHTYERLVEAGFTRTEAVDLMKADMIAYRMQGISESLDKLVSAVKHKR